MSKTSKLPAEITPFVEVDTFAFETFDPSAEARRSIVTETHTIFGNDPEDAETLGRLIDAAISIRNSKDKILQELRSIGANLTATFNFVVDLRIRKAGDDTPAIRSSAAGAAWKWVLLTTSITAPKGRNIMRVYQKFADQEGVLGAFTLSDLSLLTPPAITQEHVQILVAKKLSNEGLTRSELKKEISLLLKEQDEKLLDAEERNALLDSELDDSAAELDLSQRENRRLKEELAKVVKDLSEKEKGLRDLHADISLRTNHMGALQKSLNDALEDSKRLSIDLTNALKAKPLTEIKTVAVETLPEPYLQLEEALKDKLAQVSAVREEIARLDALKLEKQAEADEQHAEIEAGNAAKRVLDEVLMAWEPFAAKYSTAQLAVQAGNNADLYMPTLRALSGMLAKFLSEIDEAVMRKAA